MSRCRHCDRGIITTPEGWADPEAIDDDEMWRYVCDGHDSFTAEHEPVEYDDGWIEWCEKNGHNIDEQAPDWALACFPCPWDRVWKDEEWRNRWTRGLTADELRDIPPARLGLSSFYYSPGGARYYGPDAQALCLGSHLLYSAGITDLGANSRRYALALGKIVRNGLADGPSGFFPYTTDELVQGYKDDQPKTGQR